jgi:hypothetical protein
LALALGQFKQDFTKQELLAVLYASGIQSPDMLAQENSLRTTRCSTRDTSTWTAASTYGALDMRMALFMLHVLKAAKKNLSASTYAARFTNLLKSLKQFLTQPGILNPQELTLKHAIRLCARHIIRQTTHH